jgi:hypothetical protein
MLTQDDKSHILNEFPNVKLPYEKFVHKEVYNVDLLLAIPNGKKCFAWFTFFKNKPLCLLLELDNRNVKKIKNIKVANGCFSRTLCYGTVLSGTLFYHMNNPFFSIQDICFYKEKDIQDCDFNFKMNKIACILKNDLKQISYNNYFVVFGLPIISKCYSEFKKKLSTISYKLDSIRFIKNNIHYTMCVNDFNLLSETNGILNNEPKNRENNVLNNEPKNRGNNVLNNEPKNRENNVLNNEPKNRENNLLNNEPKNKENNEKRFQTKHEKMFICRADIQNDIYHLYSPSNDYVGFAAIPDYKTSVMMNKLFRNIKENNDLDALEESDDDEEFENSNIDKFVSLDKSHKMICNFSHKFKKWVPIKIIE